MAHRAKAGLPQLIVAATALYLHRLTSAQDLVLGLPVTGRLGTVSRRTPGMLSNVLPLRLTVRPGMSLSQLIEKVAEQVRRGLLHQRYRTEDLGRDLGLLAHDQKLFGTSINVMAFDRELLFAGLRTTARNLSNGPVHDLSIVVYDRSKSNELGIDFEANPALYSADELASHQQRFLRLLEAIAANPGEQIGRLELLEPEERRRILIDWNDTACEVPPATLPGLFEDQVRRSPDATALVFEESTLSYAELNAQANRVVHLLISRGVGPEDLVAIALPRSIEMVVTLLGILKAGAAYLPLDPEYPAERLAYMLRDAQPACVLTSARVAQRLPESFARLVLDHPDTVRALAQSQETNPSDAERTGPLSAHNPAYVIYTSGSTGTPKGVVVTHQNVVRLFGATAHWFHFDSDDVWTLFHSYGFDFSVWELWGALLYGGRLVVIPYLLSRSPPEFLHLLAKEGVTVLNQTPSAFYQLMEAEGQDPQLGQKLALRYVIFGGEALEFRRLADWYQRHSGTAPLLLNMYGITETTVHVSYLALEQQAALAAAGSLIGRGLPDLRVYVLDENLQPVPVGVPGELHIAGAGLARGYLKRPALSAERFVADPYGAPGTRMYRTGDLARWRAEGELEFLGRADQQLKIRGFRIEPGEIEAVLLRHASVAQAAVIAGEHRGGDKRLVGYVVAQSGQRADPALLRSHLGQSLPEYMVPGAIVVLESSTVDAQRQAGPQSAAGAGVWRERRLARATHCPGRDPLRALCRDSWPPTGRDRGQLLCARRSLASGHSSYQPGALDLGTGTAHSCFVRGAQRRRTGHTPA